MNSQAGLRPEHLALQKGITWKFIMGRIATQCGEVYDELGCPSQGQYKRISECPLEK